MALTDRQIGDLAVRAYPDLRAGSRNALLQLFLALRDDYVATINAAITALQEGGMHFTDSEGNELTSELDNGRRLLGVKSPEVETLLTAILLKLTELVEQRNG